jgi:hypothetical protein
MVSRCTHAPEILAGHESELRLAKAVVKPKVAGAFHYLITTFFYPPVRKARTTLAPPILRPEILAARPGDGDHLLVYQTSTSNSALPELLARSGRECRIYGLRRDLREEVVEGKLRYRPFSEAGFVEDLRTARGVIAAGGFTLMGESVYLQRPMLAIPIRKQFEQVLNARYLEKEGYGLGAEEVTPARLGEFLERIPELGQRLAGYRQDGNRQVLAKLDQLLIEAVQRGGGPRCRARRLSGPAAGAACWARTPRAARCAPGRSCRCSGQRRRWRGGACARSSSRPTSSWRSPACSTSTCRWARSAARGRRAS